MIKEDMQYQPKTSTCIYKCMCITTHVYECAHTQTHTHSQIISSLDILIDTCQFVHTYLLDKTDSIINGLNGMMLVYSANYYMIFCMELD